MLVVATRYREMASSGGDGLVKEGLIIGGLSAAHMIYAVYLVFLNRVLALGADPVFIVILGSFFSSLFVLPFAVTLERRKWPKRISPVLVAKFGLIALGGVTGFQGLMLLGIKKTSPAIASAMPNLAPGFIFIIAACLRFEKFEIRCKYSRAKILGTLVCLGGAISMSFLATPPGAHAVASRASGGTIYNDWIMGCLYLLAAVVVLSCNTVLQAATMVDFPAPFSLCVITSLMGATLTALLQIIMKGNLEGGSPMISMTSIFAVVFVGGAVTSICAAFQTWCVNQKGPVLVSIFSPIQTVCSAVLSAIILKEVIRVGSLAGMFLMFSGLYIVLWAKKKEAYTSLETDESSALRIHDVEKPLLS